MVEYLRRLFGLGHKTSDTYATTQTARRPNPNVEFYGKLPPNLNSFGFLRDGDKDDLYEAGFRDGDFALLRLRQNGTSAEMPARILRSPRTKECVHENEDGTKTLIPIMALFRTDEIPPQTLPSLVAHVDTELIQLGAVEDALRIYPITDKFSRELTTANLVGGDELVTAEVSLRYRPQPSQDQAILLQGVSMAYPRGLRRHFDGIQLEFPITEEIVKAHLYRRLIEVLNRRIENAKF